MSVAASTMITYFNQYYDKETNLSAPGYEDAEVLVFINNAQKSFVKDRMFGKRFGEPAFEDNQKRVTDLMHLIQYKNYDTASDYYSYSTFSKCRYVSTTLADEFYYIVSVEACVTRSYPVVTKEWITCDLIKNINAYRFDTTTFNKPFFIKPKYFVLSSSLMVMFDAYTTGYGNATTDHKIRMRYLQAPTAVSVASGCRFHDSVIQEIIAIAVREAMQVSQDQRFKTKVIEEEQIKTQ